MIDDFVSFVHNTIVRYITCMKSTTDFERIKKTTLSAATKSNLKKMDSMKNFPNLHNNKIAPPPSIVLNVEQFIRDVENRPAIWNRNYHCNKLFMEQTWDELSAIHKLSKQTLKTKWKGLRDNFRVEYKRIPRNENGEMLIPPETHDSKWTHYHALLFLTDHMRHRQPKMESDYYYNSHFSNNDDDYEQTLVEPDLTNGLIQLPDDHEDSPSPRTLQLNGVQVTMRPIPRTAPENNSNDSMMYSQNGMAGNSYTACGSNSSSTGVVPTLKLKRKRSSEDHHNHNPEDVKPNIDGSSETDDDYHYLLSLHPYMKQLNSAQKLRIRTKIQKLIFKELYKEDIEEGR